MSITIMIVDDDTDDIDIFIEAVNEVDPTINCLKAQNGLSGIKLINMVDRKPDYIFVDMNMPKMNGKQFIAEIRKNSMFDKIKLIIYSTSKLNDDLLHGADQFICKPTSQEELCSEIAKIIGIHLYPQPTTTLSNFLM